jgi:hypothetical protein
MRFASGTIDQLIQALAVPGRNHQGRFPRTQTHNQADLQIKVVRFG